MRIRLSNEAREFLAIETEYLRQRSPLAVRQLIERMRMAWKNLGDFPNMGPVVEDGPIPGTRCLVVGNYVLTDDLSNGSVEMTAIRHRLMHRTVQKKEKRT